MFTQPRMYQVIKKHKNVLDLYAERLIQQGVVSQEDVQELIAQYEKICEDALAKAKSETKLEFRFLMSCLQKFYWAGSLNERKIGYLIGTTYKQGSATEWDKMGAC